MRRSKFNGRAGRTDPARRRRIGQRAAQEAATEKLELVAEKPDRGARIDRLATRVGAFSVVAIAGYPLLRLAWLLLEACRRDLPIAHDDRGWVILLMVFALMVAAVLIFFGIAATCAVIEMIGEPRTWRAFLGRVFVALVGAYCLFVTGALIAMGDSSAGPFNQSADDLALTLSVCDQEQLTGYACLNAREFCRKGEATNAESCRQYLQELRPTTGRNP